MPDLENADIEQIQIPPQHSGIVSHVLSLWEEAKREKLEIEQIMIDTDRDIDCKYDSTTEVKIKATGVSSSVFEPTVAQKVRDIKAWLSDIYKEKYFLKPTPIADIPPDIVAAIEQDEINKMETALMQFAVGNMPLETIPETTLAVIQNGLRTQEKPIEYRQILGQKIEEAKTIALKRAQELAEERAQKMKKKIDDQLVEMKFNKVFRDFLDDFAKYPFAIFKKEYIKKPTKTWVRTGNSWKIEIKEKTTLNIRRVSPYDIYPVSNSVDINDIDIIQRERYTRAQLNSFVGTGYGFSDNAIRYALNKHKDGINEALWTDSERESLDKGVNIGTNKGSLIDTLICHCTIPGSKINEWAKENDLVVKDVDKDNAEDEYNAEIWMIANVVIKVGINKDPLGKKPYMKACFESIPGKFYGKSPRQLLSNIPQVLNDLSRYMHTNCAYASGFIAEIDDDRVKNGDQINAVPPYSVLHSDSKRGVAAGRAVNFHQPPLIAPQLLPVHQHFQRIADNATLPPFAHGSTSSSGAEGTASGLSMLIDMSDRVLKNVVEDVDEVVDDIITCFYDHNMEFDPDESIKGDIEIEAGGVLAVSKMRQNLSRKLELLQYTQAFTPLMVNGDGMPTGQVELLKPLFEDAGIDTDKVFPMFTSATPKIFTPQGVNPRFSGVSAGAAPKPGLKNLLPDGTPAGGTDINRFQNRRGANTRLANG